MIFKDEAANLAARWRALRVESEIGDIAAQTAVALARDPNVPEEVLSALDGLLRDYEDRGRGIVRIVRYIDSLTIDHEAARV